MCGRFAISLPKEAMTEVVEAHEGLIEVLDSDALSGASFRVRF